ncbi:MAG TPA: LLM class flavin-dependent oxidoreductase, partial [Paenibacillaceae bacterium]
PLQPPDKAEELVLTPIERAHLEARMSLAIIGGRETVKKRLAEFLERHEADEIMAVTYIFDPAKQIRSYELLKEAAEAVRR